MSSFLDEKTKELFAEEHASVFRSDHFSKHKDSYLAGWNECEKHVRESVVIGFDAVLEQVRGLCQHVLTLREEQIAREVWQACVLAKYKETTEKDKRIKELEKSSMYDNAVIKHLNQEGKNFYKRITALESQLKERDEALIDLVKFVDDVACENIVFPRSRSSELIKKHQSLINQIKESRK